jgi:hypothetical protein
MGGVAHGQVTSDPNRRIFVVIQLGGGWDGLNTVVPYTDSRYIALRPKIGFTEAELKDEAGASTILGSEPFGLNPALGELKSLYDAGKVGIVLGVGYPNQNLSHFFATDIWQTANTTGAGSGWLGRYADQNLLGKSGLSAVSIGGGGLPKAFYANNVVVPSIAPAGGADPFVNYAFQTDPRFAGDKNNQIRPPAHAASPRVAFLLLSQKPASARKKARRSSAPPSRTTLQVLHIRLPTSLLLRR